ncbi:nucleic-acid-binding protein from transposon X-element [Trichonephila inaurata madagascariensis]|uniref:Nucleic-acid-binding protein from transposon X-element n=1 Tax=Trichonephila inaurata madagascariensis TaxID=2747483 RepID=A0A8X6YGU8_9ARAC|nr:nucleic-acid-binding protein from transposon X-element [Trichonephila inaurata madagascariensis]
MLRYKKNYNLVQELNKNFPESVNKLTGNYIKIQASSIEDHRAITALLKQKREEFYVIPSPADRPLKVVIKGLPSSTSIEDIKTNLTEQGVLVIKVAQLTQRKSKFPLPIFMVKVRKNAEDAMDIYDVSKCCYMSIVIDPFKKRPGATQCYKRNYFNHSSANCEMKPRCLKCSKDHPTGNCPIKERIKNPECIKCKEKGHMGNWSNCKAFPQIKSKKRSHRRKSQLRKKSQPKSFDSEREKVIPVLTFANATNSDQQKTAPVAKTEPAKKKSKPVSVINQEGETTSGFISAMSEFRKLFQSFPGLIEAGKTLKNAKRPEERLDMYHGFCRKPPHLTMIYNQSGLRIANKARKIYQYTRHPSDKTILNRLQHKIHRKVRDFTQKQWEETLLRTLMTAPYGAWPEVSGQEIFHSYTQRSHHHSKFGHRKKLKH